MKKLYTSPDRVFIYLLKSKLSEKGIQCIIKNEAVAGPAAGEVPPVVAKPELWVASAEDYAMAASLLNDELKQLNQPGPNWTCPTCHEQLEGQFQVCWHCGTHR